MKGAGIILLFVIFTNVGFGQNKKIFDAIEVREKPIIDSLIIKFIGSHKWKSKNTPNFLLIMGSKKQSELVGFDLSYIDSLHNGNVYATAPVLLNEKNLRYFNFDNHLILVLGDNDPHGLIADTYKRKQYTVYIDKYIPGLSLESEGGLYTYKAGRIEDFPGIAYHDFGSPVKASNDTTKFVLHVGSNILQTRKIVYIPVVKENYIIDNLVESYKHSIYKNIFDKNSSIIIHFDQPYSQYISLTCSRDSIHKKVIYTKYDNFEDKTILCFKYKHHFILFSGEYDSYNFFKLTSKKERFIAIPIKASNNNDFNEACLYKFEYGKFELLGYLKHL